MLKLPTEVICGGILPYLSVLDLQALDTAYTNKCLRPPLRQVWKTYQYDSLSMNLVERQMSWLFGVGVQIISVGVVVVAQKSILSKITTLKRLHVQSGVYSRLLLQIVANNPNLVQLHVSKVHKPNIDDAVSALAQNCRQLHTLHIGGFDIVDTGITSVAHYCSDLHSLHLSNSMVTDAGIQALCDNCPHLKHIGLSYCLNLTNSSLISISDTYPQLQSIYLYFINKFTDDGFIYFASKCQELRSVTISHSLNKSRAYVALWEANPNLMDVNISDNLYLVDDVIIRLAQSCPLLQNLNISSSPDITDAAVFAVAEHCPQLRSLNIYHCFNIKQPDAFLIFLGQHCHDLKSINLYLSKVSDVGIAALAASCPLLQEFFARSAEKITDTGLVALAHGCRDLRMIKFERCDYIGIDGISAIAEQCPMISELQIILCPKVNDACLYAIAEHCHNLTFISMVGLNEISVAAVLCVVSSCSMLDTMFCYCRMSYEDRKVIRQLSQRLTVIKGLNLY